MFGSGEAGAAWVMGAMFWGWYLFCGAVDELIVVQRRLRRKWTVQAKNGVTDWHYSPRDYWRVVGVLAAEEQSWLRVGLTGNALVQGLERGVGAGTFMCASGGLGASGALASAFKGGECGGLTKFNCPGTLDPRGKWWSNCKPSKCLVAWDSCQAVFGAFSWVGIPKFIGDDEGVYWGLRCSCMILFGSGDEASANSVPLQHLPCSRPVPNWPNLEQVSCSWLNFFP